MAKHGVVALTKAFKYSEPDMFANDGIKCYALAPCFADTNLVRSCVAESAKNPGLWTRQGQSITSMEMLQKTMKMRVLNVHEVGAALMQALQYDRVCMGIRNKP